MFLFSPEWPLVAPWRLSAKVEVDAYRSYKNEKKWWRKRIRRIRERTENATDRTERRRPGIGKGEGEEKEEEDERVKEMEKMGGKEEENTVELSISWVTFAL